MAKKFTLQPIKQPKNADESATSFTEVFYRRIYIGTIVRVEAEDGVKFYFKKLVNSQRAFTPAADTPVFASQKDAMVFIKRQHKGEISDTRKEIMAILKVGMEDGMLDDGLRDYLNDVRKRVKKQLKAKKSETVALKKAA